ncbi:hypothetical protein [Vibrio fluvialis]|uniref:hypothetical protein n=1 Tax=Vibrio fluvialis TaxID=676 RepID=UPI0023A9F6A6|nr:hypothetical protein [Vibrio fluvialis]MDE5179115.1 hypothetical protein [Vibrio fluvialis]
MNENSKVALGLLGLLALLGSLTFVQFTGKLFGASNALDQVLNIMMWIVVICAWAVFFVMLWVFVTRNLNQSSHTAKINRKG